MPTSPTNSSSAFFLKIEGGDWALIEDGRVVVNPDLSEDEVHAGPIQTVLAVPGEAVTIHWLDLADGLTEAQAAAAARLQLADASLTPLAEMHVAVGAAEGGLTPVALAPVAAMNEWTVSHADIVIPTSLLLLPPAEGLVRRGIDHRGTAQAFSVEPELAELVTGGQGVAEIDEAAFQAGLAEALAAPALNLRQGAFAKRRRLRVVEGSWRKLALYSLALAAITLVIQIAAILSYTFAADRLENQIAARGQSSGPARSAAFGPVASLLFEAIRSTPNAELTRLDWRADGSLAASLRVDTPATLAALRARAEASGLRIEGNPAPNGGAAELVVRL